MVNPVSEVISVVEKRDKLGRLNNGFKHIHERNLHKRIDGRIYNRTISARFDKETYEELSAKSKQKSKAEGKEISIAELMRRYIEWGLENDGE